jgi:ABC-type lipoprotein export system ATPase subunit
VTVIVVDGVSHGYGAGADRTQALTDVSLTVAEGEVVCVAGPSGSGKTALCHLVAGLETPDTGSVTVAGTSTDGPGDWSLVAVVPQQHGLLAELSVEQNVALPALRTTNGWDGAADVLEALDLTELAGRAAAETSLGEQQRTAIARALVLSPRVLVLDEPTGHQDDRHVEQVLAVVRAAAAAGSAVLVASHDDRVLEAADRVVRLAEGRLS